MLTRIFVLFKIAIMPPYRIKIDRERCTSCGLCLQEAPSTFEFDDDDIAIVTNPEGDAAHMIFSAAESCPVDAIALYDDETGEIIWPD